MASRRARRRQIAEARGRARSRDALPAAAAGGGAGSSRSLLFGLSCFHYYTAGFGLLQETLHRGIHIACVLGPDLPRLLGRRSATGGRRRRPARAARHRHRRLALRHRGRGRQPLRALRLPRLQFRVGNPDADRLVMGTVMIVVLLEATRRSVGWPLPIIAVVLMVYALSGRSCRAFSRIPATPGKASSITSISRARAFSASRSASSPPTSSTTCCSACSRRASGSAASSSISPPRHRPLLRRARQGLDLRLGTLRHDLGLSIANTVTVGSLTIPAMIRLGYPRHFAAPWNRPHRPAARSRRRSWAPRPS